MKFVGLNSPPSNFLNHSVTFGTIVRFKAYRLLEENIEEKYFSEVKDQIERDKLTMKKVKNMEPPLAAGSGKIELNESPPPIKAKEIENNKEENKNEKDSNNDIDGKDKDKDSDNDDSSFDEDKYYNKKDSDDDSDDDD